MVNINVDRLNEVLQNKEFATYVLSLETAEEAQRAFAEQGIEFTIDEIEEIGNAIREISASDEFSDTDLESVTGGAIITGTITAWAVAKTVIAVGAAGVAIYKWVKSW